MPVILECLRNEALRSRRSLIASAAGDKRYTLNESLKHPWISLFEIDGDTRKAIPFEVEDGRLLDPPRTLAIYSLNGGEFKPYRLLTDREKEKEKIPTGVLTVVPEDKMDQ